MAEYLVVMVWFGENEPEIRIVEGKSKKAVYEEYEHNMNDVVVLPLTKVKKALNIDKMENIIYKLVHSCGLNKFEEKLLKTIV